MRKSQFSSWCDWKQTNLSSSTCPSAWIQGSPPKSHCLNMSTAQTPCWLLCLQFLSPSPTLSQVSIELGQSHAQVGPPLPDHRCPGQAPHNLHPSSSWVIALFMRENGSSLANRTPGLDSSYGPNSVLPQPLSLGVALPLSLVHHAGLDPDGMPLLIYYSNPSITIIFDQWPTFLRIL